MIGQTISHYKILEKLGEGGMGVIYKAEDTKLKRIVALKFLPSHLLTDEEEKTRFLHEAQSASALNHSNITTIYEINEVEGQTFIAMECIEGETLKDKVEKGPLKTKELLNIAIAVADGLNAAHEHDIVHRDIKSENIMISKTAPVKIMDFGLAKRKGMTKITKTGSTLGTLAYMSPEQAEGLEVDRRSDLFSFGVVMYEMATGQLPFKGEHDAAIMYSIVNEAPILAGSINPNIPKELERIIHKALKKEVEERYQHADDLQTDLNNLKKEIETKRTAITATHIPITKKLEKKPIWRKPSLFFISVFIIAIVVVLTITLRRAGQVPIVEIEENSLAVLYFENLKDPDDSERLGQILQELIIADLSGISPLKVCSSQRLYDIQKQLGSRERKKIDRDFATEVARQARAETMLIGSISQLGGVWILTSQMINVITGEVIKSQRVDGNDLYTMVDDLTMRLRSDLDLPITKGDRVELAVSEKTTSSMEAYQYYLEGIDLLNKSEFDSAIVQFEKATSTDSAFHQAYFKMAIAQWWSQSTRSGEAIHEQAEKSLKRVLSSDRLMSQKERLLVEGFMAIINGRYSKGEPIFRQLLERHSDEKEAWYGLGEAYFHLGGEDLKALDAFERILNLDPEFKLAYQHIFDIYYNAEMFDRGIEVAKHYINMYPGEVFGYSQLALMYRGKGNLDLALEVYDKGLELNPKAYSIISSKAHTYQLMGKYDDAMNQFTELIKSDIPLIWQDNGTYWLSSLYALQGQYSKAVDLVAGVFPISKAVGVNNEVDNLLLRVRFLIELGNTHTASLLLDQAKSLHPDINRLVFILFLKGMIYARLNQVKDLISVINELQDLIRNEEITSGFKVFYNVLLIEQYSLIGEEDRALMEFDDLKVFKVVWDANLYKQAMLLLKKKDFDKALSITKQMQRPSINRNVQWRVFPRAFYARGRIYEEMGELDLARENYEKLLVLWKDGDESISERQDAIKRLSKIIRVQG